MIHYLFNNVEKKYADFTPDTVNYSATPPSCNKSPTAGRKSETSAPEMYISG